MATDTEKKQEIDTQKEYDKLKQKYSLPDYKEMDREFALGNLESSNFILRSILIKINDRCNSIRKILGDLIQPENHLSDMQEAENLSEPEKKKVMELFKKMSLFEKEFIIVEFDYSDEAAADLIKRFISEWLQVKQDFLKILESLRNTWKGKDKSDQEYGYFG